MVAKYYNTLEKATVVSLLYGCTTYYFCDYEYYRPVYQRLQSKIKYRGNDKKQRTACQNNSNYWAPGIHHAFHDTYLVAS
jgi:hypothetical protein